MPRRAASGATPSVLSVNRIIRVTIGLVLLGATLNPAGGAEPAIDFDRQIRPILSDHCFTCHGPDAGERATEMRLDTSEGLFGKVDGRQVVSPQKPGESELIRRIASGDELVRMPPPDSGRRLSDEQVALIRRWIQQGAKWRQHWSYEPPQRPGLPGVADSRWPRNAIDRFVLARLENEGIAPSPEASKAALLRRVTLDLTGLPPTIDELDAFLSDRSPNAYEKVVDRLLASPHYGQRMVLPWLDAARYSDTNGYQTDGTRAMWPWRDGVIAALNRNQPFDQFTIEQVAGDMLPEASLRQKIASGFHRNHMLNGEGGRIAEESRVEYVVDRLETTGATWLGLTVGCGRCHDHKYDPLSQREFYGMYAYFNNIDETGAVDRKTSTAAPTIRVPDDQQRIERRRLTAELAQVERKLAGAGDAEKEELQAARKAIQQKLQKVGQEGLITMVMKERAQTRPTYLLERGQYDKHGEPVQPGVPSFLPPLPEGVPNNRLGFARWLVDPSNPLTARVTVNRYWQQFFGSGLVKTAEDFGSQGQRPSHPELLDWLAVEFRSNWNVKALHRLIVTSATYRQSSHASAALRQRDPENRLLARGPSYRLSSFVIRDQALALAGLLVDKLGGPPVRPYQPEGIWSDFSFGKIVYKQDHGEKLYRRSLYTFWRRSVGPTYMFDTSPRQVCSVRQRRTNTPLHALVLLNEVSYVEAARGLARRMIREGGDTPQQRIAWGFRAATSRQPIGDEVELLTQRLQSLIESYRDQPKAAEELLNQGESPRDGSIEASRHAAYTGIASLLLNLDETISKP